MLGGRKKLQRDIDNLDAKLNSTLNRLHDIKELLDYISNRVDNLTELTLSEPDIPEPIDKYAKMKNSDGLYSYQAYKARKAGLGGDSR